MKSICLMVSFFLISAVSFAGVSQDRIDSSVKAFSGGIDQLLLDTQHVYVQPTHKVTGFSLEGIGVIFTGQIAMTATGGVSAMIHGFSGKEINIELDGLDDDLEGLSKDLGELQKTLEEISPDLEQIGKKAEKGEELSAQDKEKLAKLGDLKKLSKLGQLSKLALLADSGDHKIIINGNGDGTTMMQGTCELKKETEERLKAMDSHLAGFKKELMTTVMDFGPVLKGLNGNDEIIVVLQISEKEFQTKFGTNQLVLRISFKDLAKIQDGDPSDPKVQKNFRFNI
jgi:hypothetical protein